MRKDWFRIKKVNLCSDGLREFSSPSEFQHPHLQ